MIAPKNESKPRELVPAGNHVATLYEILYIGTVETPYFNDDGSKKEQNKVRLTFELPNELREFGEDKAELPMVISKECTFSMYKGTQTAVLRTIAHALIGESLKDEEAESFDIDELLGKSCMLEIEHDEYDGNPYAKAVGFGSLPKGTEKPKQVNESKVKSIDTMSEEELGKLPEFIRKKIYSSKEYLKRIKDSGTTPSGVNEVMSTGSTEIKKDEIPF